MVCDVLFGAYYEWTAIQLYDDLFNRGKNSVNVVKKKGIRTIHSLCMKNINSNTFE